MLATDNNFTQSDVDFAQIDANLEQSFAAIAVFVTNRESLMCSELRIMRDRKLYLSAGYTSFENYCETRFTKYGGYRRVNQLIAAHQVMESLKGTKYEDLITNENQARSVAKILKFPDRKEKLLEVAAIAVANSNGNPTSKDFAKAVLQVVPKKEKDKPSIPRNAAKVQEQLFFSGVKVRVSSLSHPLYREEGEISGDAPNNSQVFVQFADSREIIFIRDLKIVDAVVERKLPAEYQEAIAQMEQQHKEELARLEEDIRAGITTELEAIAINRVEAQLRSAQEIAQSRLNENIGLQQRIEELESLRILEAENSFLQQRIGELERALEDRPKTEWENTFTKQAEKVINFQVLKTVENLEPELHLRTLATGPIPRRLFSEVNKMIVSVRYFLDRVPLCGRRVFFQGRYGTLAEVIEDKSVAVVDWDEQTVSDAPDDTYGLVDIEVLPTVEGLSQGSAVAWFEPSKPAYSYHGVIQEILTNTNEAIVFWKEIGKSKQHPISALRLIRFPLTSMPLPTEVSYA